MGKNMDVVRRIKNVKRYKQIALLLLKYGGPNVVRSLGMEEFLHSDEAAQKARAEDLPQELEELGPTFVKLGQFLSTRRDFIPPRYLKTLAKLQSTVGGFPFEEVRAIIQEELGRDIDEVFSRFSEEPLAAASLAQVHRAWLLDGTPVVVKVQRPDIAAIIREDMEAFSEIADFLEDTTELGKRFMLRATLKEFGKSLRRELDFRKEATVLKRMGENLQEYDNVVTPLPVLDLTARRVLTMQYIAGEQISEVSQLRRDSVNGAELADSLFRAYLHQLLLQGVYHADPHPGNVFLTHDDRIALLDFGMVGRIPDSMKTDLLRLLLAMGDDNGEDVAKFTVKLGSRLRDFDETGFTREVRDLVSDYHELPVEQIESGDLLMKITGVAAEHGVRLPNEFVMMAKTLLHLDEVARILDPEFNPNEAIRNHAFELMEKLFFRTISFRGMYGTALEGKEFLDRLPERANRLISALASNRFRIRADVVNEHYIVSALKEAVNRLTAGLILSAMIIGAAIMLHVDTAYKFLGYPAIAIICFILAGIGGIVLIVRVLFHDTAPDKVREDEEKRNNHG